MKVHSQLASVLYKLAIFLLSAFGVLAVCGLFAHRFDFAPLRKYVCFANAICAVYFFLCVLIGLFTKKDVLPRLRGAVILLLFVSVIMDAADLTGERSTAPIYLLLHAVVPVLALMDWLLFGEKGKLRWISPVLWLIVPNVYFLYVVLRAKLTDAGWLYAFLNPQTAGRKSVLLTVLFVDLFALALGYLIVSIDKLTVKRKKSKHS